MAVDDQDAGLRVACFAALGRLQREFGEDVPYRGGLDRRFTFDGAQIPFLAPAKGIFRARAQKGPAALSINTSIASPYDDGAASMGFAYAYRRGDIEQPDNRALRAACESRAPLVYFVGSRPGWYVPVYPVTIVADHPEGNHVIVSMGEVLGVESVSESFVGEDVEIQRAWSYRTVRTRLHQARFRGMVLPAYKSSCAMCRLKEVRLLDAAHIVPDSMTGGVAAIRNGLSLCSIHHRAYDKNLVAVTPDYAIQVARRLLEDTDGPMLELLKGFHGDQILLPSSPQKRPDRQLLEQRLIEFNAA